MVVATQMAPRAAIAQGAAAAAASLCTLGQRLEVVDFGKWHAAVVIGVRDDGYAPCRVHWIGYATTMDGWVPRSYLRPTGAGPVQPIPGGPNVADPTLDSIRRAGASGGPAAAAHAVDVATGHYTCVAFVVNHLVTTGEFTIAGAGAYRSGTTSGRYSYDARTGLVRFQGGTWDGQSGDYTTAPRPTVQMHGPSGRQVMGCERGTG